MPSQNGQTVCGWRWQSIPFPFRSHPKSKPSNSSGPPWQFATEPCVESPTTPRSLRTSKSGRFLREAPGSLRATCLRPACDRRYPFPQKTSESGAHVRRKVGCNGSETTGTRRLFAVRAARCPRGSHVKTLSAVSRATSPYPPDGKPARENPSLSNRPSKDPCNREQSDSHTQHCHPAPKRQWSEVSHRPSVGVVPPLFYSPRTQRSEPFGIGRVQSRFRRCGSRSQSIEFRSQSDCELRGSTYRTFPAL